MMHLLIAALIVLVVLALIGRALWWAFIPQRCLPGNRVRHNRIRVRLRLHPGRGHATVFELWLRWGRLAAFRRSDKIRPSLPFWARVIVTAAGYSIMLGRAHYRHGMRVPLEEHVLVMAPPRTGKTGWLARIVMHYPGPVLSTTTKPDVYGLTSGIRARGGRPVEVFNPAAIGAVASTFRWSPIAGCEDKAVAIRRADGFANAVNVGKDSELFKNAARTYLRAMFHAAALVDGDMMLVAMWALRSSTGGAMPAEEILTEHGAVDWSVELSQLRNAADKTAATNEIVMSQMLGFLMNPALAAAVLPDPGDTLDLTGFLRKSGTLYMIADNAGQEDAPLAPLFAAMTSELHYVATQIGQASKGGRLDPPLLMALDEVTQICPVPLPFWLADSGGKGVQIIPVVHGEAQLRERWGKDGAQIVMDTCGAKAWLPGITDPNTLKMASELCDQAAYRLKGQEHESMHNVMTPGMVRALPARHALVIRGGLSPVIARLPMAWKDRLYKKARRRGWATLPAAARASWDASVLLADHVPGELPDPVPAVDSPETVAARAESAYSWTSGVR
jgi:type IV secretory pathway TraG/TraD family ATPase VirD4